MYREIWKLAVAGVLVVLMPGMTSALTRDIAELQPARLTFNRSVLNQLTFGTYREPFDELQTRPYNLLFTNIGRHANLSPWEGQEGRYTRYFNALIGNNGATNVDNGADSVQGSWVQRASPAISWGLSAAVLTGAIGTDVSNPATDTLTNDDSTGIDVRGAVGWQISQSRVLGFGIRAIRATSEDTSNSLAPGVGGSFTADEFQQLRLLLDVGMRHFLGPRSSWEIQLLGGYGGYERDMFSQTLDAGGTPTDRVVARNYDISELNLAVFAGYNRLRAERPGETQFRLGLERSQRELDNSDLAFNEIGGVTTPTVTLVGQDPIASTSIRASAQSVFQAGHTEMFVGGDVGYNMLEGSTSIETAGGPVTETIDDTRIFAGLTAGLRQPLFQGKLRFIASGRADLLDEETNTNTQMSLNGGSVSRSNARFAVGIEGVLANVTFDLAWLFSEQAPITPPALGFPSGSRTVIELNRLLVSAAVSW